MSQTGDARLVQATLRNSFALREPAYAICSIYHAGVRIQTGIELLAVRVRALRSIDHPLTMLPG